MTGAHSRISLGWKLNLRVNVCHFCESWLEARAADLGCHYSWTKGPLRAGLEEAAIRHSTLRLQILKPQNIFICLEKMSAGDHESFLTASASLCLHTKYKYSTMKNIPCIVRIQILTGQTQMQQAGNLWSCMNKPVCNIPFSSQVIQSRCAKFFVSKIRYNLVLFRLECRLCLVVNLIYNAVACIPSHAPSKTWSWLWLTMIWHCRL